MPDEVKSKSYVNAIATRFRSVGRDGALVVSTLAFYSNSQSSNPADYFSKFLNDKRKINKKRLGLALL